MPGVQVGLRNLHYALLTTDPLTGAPTYETPVKIAGAITANINPNPATGTLFADDGPMEVAATIGEIELEIGAADIPFDVQAALLGHTLTTGVLVKKSTDVAPWVAIGFESVKSNGSKRYVWLTKGKFQEPEQNHETKGDSVNFQTPTITGSFVKRDCDDVWQASADEDATGYIATTGSTWFTKVHGETA